MYNTLQERSTYLEPMSGMEGLFKLKGAPEKGATESEVIVTINADHPIFQGHFPEQPVLPGVCMVQIAMVIAGAMYGKDLRVKNARTIKFLAPVDPRSTPELSYRTTLTPTTDGVKVEAQALTGEAPVMKLSAEMVAE